MYKAILIRFLKGAIAGALTQISVIAFSQPVQWSEFPVILNNLAIAGAFGFMTGLLLAFNKWASWKV